MQSKWCWIAAGASAFAMSVCVPGNAQTYPAKPVRIIAPYPPGGGADTAARIIAQALKENTRQQFIVDNRPGASGQIGTELAARASPDGYTLLLGNVGPNAILPASGSKIPYDPIADFMPVSLVAVSEYALTVHPSLPVKSVNDLIALAKSQPSQIAFGSTGIAGGPHLAGELLNNLAGVQLLHVAYKGGAPVMTALLSGEVPVSFSTLPTVLPFRANGKLRVVAVTGARRSPFAPDIPTVSESIRGYEVTQWYGVLAPARTESGIVSTLNSEIVKAVARDNTRQHFASSGATATSTTPAAFRQLIQNEIQKYRKVFASSSIKLD
ncbi:MAG: Bug family tripartite tricarboxylate transporter substrate binding protein [Burkholderiales bacterium]